MTFGPLGVTLTDMKLYVTGGAVRDHFLERLRPHEEYSVECLEGFQAMTEGLKDQGFEILGQEGSIVRARYGEDNPYADFRLCRNRDNEPADILEDLEWRDFRMNAVAIDQERSLIDPYNGLKDIQSRLVRCVGSPEEKFEQDPLRIIRALRFGLTLGFSMDITVRDAMADPKMARLMSEIPLEQRRIELEQMFKRSSVGAMQVLLNIANPDLRDAIIDGIEFQPLASTS